MAQELPKTVAETSNYLSTSRYDDVMAFIAAIQRVDPDIRVETFGTSHEGRALPLVIAGPPGIVTPESAHASGLPIVFVMANIHAGEVEGKEAAQMILRDLVSTHRRLRDELVALIAPIYNADGNESIARENRPTQNGPVNGCGMRETAEGLDLNRDYMKLESPEARGLVKNVLWRWDPLLTIDLHTTNGSYHGYHLTYSPMLNPNADEELIEFSRETLLPRIREKMKERRGRETYYYGNFADQLQPEKGWYTFDSRPRFGNNYVGLRNRFTILSEAYSYIDFRARVEVTYEFVHEIVDATLKYGGKMMKIAAKADERIRRGKLRKLGTRFEIKAWKDVEILWETCIAAEPGKGHPDPETGRGMIERSGEIVPVKMTDYGIFVAKERESVPYAYVIDEAAVANLQTHGIVVEALAEETKLEVEQWNGAKFKSRKEVFPAGAFIVRMNQPLARLAFYLLEPTTDDGLFEWKVMATVSRIEKPVGVVAIKKR